MSDNTRQDFEHWMKSKYDRPDLRRYPMGIPAYKDYITQTAWEAWQAAWNEAYLESDAVAYPCMLGVGSGEGKLFVHGNYESIKECQRKLIRLEELESQKNCHEDSDDGDTTKLNSLMKGLEIPPAAASQGSYFLECIGKAIASQAKQVAERSNQEENG